MSVYYEFDGDDVVLAFSYDPTAVEALKFAVPKGHRLWVPEERVWRIKARFWERVKTIFVQYGVFSAAEFNELKRPVGGGDWETLWVRQGAPVEVVDAAYRALARLHHPDLAPAGTSEGKMAERHRRMVRINLAYEKLRARKGG